MAEDKEEGEVHVTSFSSSVEEGEFSSGLDSQISTIEDQLHRAQATLFELQELKAKLEVERHENHKKERLEKEVYEAEKIKKENERLREELKEYHTEIGSLKEIIGSLKDDLVKTAEKLEHKVNKSLKSLDDSDSHLDKYEAHKHSHTVHRVHREAEHKSDDKHELKATSRENEHRNFFNDHLDKDIVKKQVPDSDITQSQQKTAENQTEKIDAKSSADLPAKPETSQASEEISKEQPQVHSDEAPVSEAATPAQTQSQSVQGQEASATTSENEAPKKEVDASNQENNLLENFLKSDTASNPEGNVGAVITKIESGQEQSEATAEELLSEDFDEYEEIRRELEALEGESIFKQISHQEQQKSEEGNKAEGKEQSNHEKANQEQKENKKHLLANFLKFNKKKEPSGLTENLPAGATQDLKQDAIQAESAVEKNQTNLAQITEENQKPASAETAATQTEASKPISASEDSAAAAPPAQASSPPINQTQNQQAPQPTEEANPQIKEQSKDEEQGKKGFSNLKNIFKRKKPKVRGHVDDKPGTSGFGAAGRLAAGAAVFLLLLGGGVLAYKIKNAQALRELYTSKAQEAIIAGNANVISDSVPDEFSNHDPQVKYKEAYVDLPYEDTAWVNYKDPEIGISIDYPKNTSYRLKPVGSSNLWFLRKDGYLLKIEKIETEKTLDGFAAEISKDIQYESENMVIRGRPAVHMVLAEELPVTGNIYLSKYETGIYKIWYKTYKDDSDPDDQKRVQKMLDSLDFLTSPEE